MYALQILLDGGVFRIRNTSYPHCVMISGKSHEGSCRCEKLPVIILNIDVGLFYVLILYSLLLYLTEIFAPLHNFITNVLDSRYSSSVISHPIILIMNN